MVAVISVILLMAMLIWAHVTLILVEWSHGRSKYWLTHFFVQVALLAALAVLAVIRIVEGA